MRQFLLLTCTFLISHLESQAQYSRYIVKLRDKGSNPFSISDPSQFLSQRAIERRQRYNIPVDSTDLPVTPAYITSIRSAGSVTILNVSKWLNQVAIETNDLQALTLINAMPFVIATDPVAAREAATQVDKQLNLPALNQTSSGITTRTAGFYNYGASTGQVVIHNTDFLHNHGFRGEQMQMAVLDAGFFHYLSLPTFDSIRNNNQILGTWDFVANEASVDEDNTHGMQCLSTIAANMPGVFVGTAPRTSFYLYRTEDVSSEFPIEEQNWAAGIERADSLGADISSTSLGYSTFDNSNLNHTYADMDGNTTIIARAADFAAKKGMLVVNAAGNEGNNAWHFLTTPSDADSALSVGAVNVSGIVAGFSGYGPSADGDIKPNVAAVGLNATVANPGSGLPQFSSGTSFACPNMAGVATCLWQAFPEVNNMKIISVLQASASSASNPDDRIGYGIPDVKKAFVILQKETSSHNLAATDCDATLTIKIKRDNSMQIVVERKLQNQATFTDIATLTGTGGYAMDVISFTDNLRNLAIGPIQYRFRVDIASDTSYYLDTVDVNHNAFCNGASPVDEVQIAQQESTPSLVQLSVTRVTAAKVGIVIHNASGQLIYRREARQEPGNEISNIDLNSILHSRGAYYLSVFINGKRSKTKEILRP